MASVAQARTYVTATVPGDKSPTIEVGELNDPANPYKDQYSKLDTWAMDNFSYYVTEENYSTLQLIEPNIERALKARGVEAEIMVFKSYVELDPSGKIGYLVPALAYLATPAQPETRTIADAFLSSHRQQEQAADKRPFFWSVGLRDETAMEEHALAVDAWIAPIFPKIQDWMLASGHPGDKYFFLPDGGVVIAVPEVKNDFSARRSAITRFSADGLVLKQATGDFMSWCDLILFDPPPGSTSQYYATKEHREQSGNKAGTSNNIANTGRYQTYINPARDGFVAVIDYWQGKILTPADCDLSALPIDPYPIFEMVDYDQVERVYKAQQALATQPASNP